MSSVKDPAKEKKLPVEWAEDEGMVIVRPLGWLNRGIDFNRPLVYADYHVLAMQSVLGPLAPQAIELQIQTKESE